MSKNRKKRGTDHLHWRSLVNMDTDKVSEK